VSEAVLVAIQDSRGLNGSSLVGAVGVSA